MKRPNGEFGVVDDAKLMGYCLSPVHLRGRHKARLFASALGFTQANAKDLKEALLIAARDYDCVAGKANPFGRLYEIDFVCTGPRGTATLLSVWIIEHSELFPRLVTCYPV